MPTEERLLKIDEAARILGTTEDYLYREWKNLPFAFKVSERQLRFSLQGLYAWIKERQHGRAGVQAG